MVVWYGVAVDGGYVLLSVPVAGARQMASALFDRVRAGGGAG